MSGDFVAILDAGSQFGKVIDRKVRELRVEARMMPLSTPAADLKADPKLKGIIISGGPNSVYADDAPAYDPAIFDCGLPILGICYGMQLLCKTFNGKIQSQEVREDGQDTINCETDSPLFKGLSAKERVLLTHGDSIVEAGENVRVIARSSENIIAAVQHESKPLFGVQFHPEVDLSVNGVAMFRNFLEFANLSFDFTMEDRTEKAIREIRERVGDKTNVLCLASGGVDSTVCAALLLKALSADRVTCVHINHGFMRMNESEDVAIALKNAGVDVKVIDATEDFRNATTTIKRKDGTEYTTPRLEIATNPEEKRKIIGDTFMRVSDAAIKSLNLDAENLLLAQGTLRPDLIESGSHLASNKADAIKTHHNDTELVRQLRDKGRIIEPLSDYHKDEVRELGKSLGLPEPLVMRQPFPGPGLAIRTLCTTEPYMPEDSAPTAAKIREFCKGESSSLTGETKAEVIALGLSASLLPIRSVGVQGDGRTYAHVVALTKAEKPTAEEWPHLLEVAKMIPKFAHNVNRVVFAFGAPTSTDVDKITPTTLTKDVVTRIREADDVVGKVLVNRNLVRKLSQVPVILAPVDFGAEQSGKHSITVRTFITNDFMTGVPATPGTDYMPLAVLDEIVEGLSALPFVSRVLFDMTAKPPGTTEWE